MKRNLDPATVDSLRNAWLRFGQSAIVEADWRGVGGKQ